MNITLEKLAEVLNAPFQGKDSVAISGVAFDSRHVKEGQLFIALVAENDGHDYIENALANGAHAVLVDSQHQLKEDWPAVIVDDTLIAMQKLGQWYRHQVNPKVVAITGSNGKTTTKDMAAEIANQQYRTFKTPENYNNEIGVPMTLLSMPESTEVLIVELGMDRPGQLTVLSHLVEPDIAIITMIGEAHIEFFKTRRNIAKAKLEIINGLKAEGTLIIPNDESLLTQEISHIKQHVKTFGTINADVNATDISVENNQSQFNINQQKFAIPMLGRYNIMNALAAITAGNLLHIDLKNAQKALLDFDLTKNRTEILHTTHGVTIISDVYNSNPTAVKAVLATLVSREVQGKRYVVLGDMLELGQQAGIMHAGLAESVQESHIDGVYLVGELMRKHLYPILQKHFDQTQLHQYAKDQLDDLVSDLNKLGQQGDVMLLKASHGIHLERVVDELMK